MLEQLEFTLALDVLSPLHIGTGENDKLKDLRQGKDWNTSSESQESDVALIARDNEGNPCIPSASLKGCLRNLVADKENSCQVLFGSIADHKNSDQDKTGQAGALFLRLARFNENGLKLEKNALSLYDPEKHSFIRTRTRIDGNTGTAKDKALFNQEFVPQGFRFKLCVVFDGSLKDAEKHLIPLLGRMAADTGFSVGKNSKQGSGRLRLIAGETTVTHRTLSSKKTLGWNIKPETPDNQIAENLLLTCEGPYISLDPTREGKKGDTEDSANKGVVDQDNKPILLPSTLIGALRARLSWLAQTTDAATEPDNPEHVLPDGGSPDTLSPAQRLFGVTGWKSLVRIDKIHCTKAGVEDDITSVSLDPFTAGPLEGALFTTTVNIDVQFSVKLSLARRATFGADNEKDQACFDALLKDIKENGLMLGHGTTKGFGWFTVDEGKQ